MAPTSATDQLARITDLLSKMTEPAKKARKAPRRKLARRPARNDLRSKGWECDF